MGMWYDNNNSDGEGEFLSCAWHSLFPLAAATTADGQIHLFNEGGKRVDSANVQKNAAPCLIQWHPTKKLLAVSWADGLVAVWCDSELILREGVQHHAPITCLQWSPSGNLLISADEEGVATAWQVDGRGRLASTCTFRLSEAIVQCAFREVRKETMPNLTTFFLVGVKGSIFLADDAGSCSEGISTGGNIANVLILDATDMLITVTHDLRVAQYKFSNSKLMFENEVKLSSSARSEKRLANAIWVGNGVLAISSQSSTIRIWDMLNDENLSLTIPDSENLRINCIAYNPQKNILAGGTDSGHIMLWKYKTLNKKKKKIEAWELLPKINVAGNVEQVGWSAAGNVLGARKRNGIKLFGEQVLNWSLSGRTSIIQIGPNKAVVVPADSEKRAIEINSEIAIKRIALSSSHAAIWGAKVLEVYEYNEQEGSARLVCNLNMNCASVVMDSQTIYIASGQRVDFCNFQGTVKQSITLNDDEGPIDYMDINGSFLTLTTNKNCIKLFDISRREPRHVASKNIDEFNINVRVISAKSNTNGAFVSLLCKSLQEGHQYSNQLDSKLNVYDTERDCLKSFDCANIGVLPTSHTWDLSDPRLLVCESESFSRLAELDDEADELVQKDTNVADNEVVSFFVTPEHGIFLHDRMAKPDELESLMGAHVPYFYFSKHTGWKSQEKARFMVKKTMRNFDGVDDTDTITIKAMVDFMYFLSLGNLDEAFKPLKMIKSNIVWGNMARMAVKSKRLDIAALCLGNMGNVRALQALRESVQEPEIEARAAVVALHLGMVDEAKELYMQAGRFDLLNKLYQSCGEWERALEIATTKDRINLKATFYKFAKYLDETGDMHGAVAAFEQSSAFSTEVPKMLLLKIGELEKYVANTPDKNIKKWYAQYAESQGDAETALKTYEQADDALSQVRVHCYTGNVNKAIEICERTNNPAVAYHIARHYEDQEKIKEALNFYSRAKAFNHAIRLAKEYKMDTELMHLALQGTQDAMIDAAKYYETVTKNIDKAISLYYKGGNLSKAIDLCFQIRQFNLLRDIASSLDAEKADPKLLKRCAEFFMEHGQFDKAVRMLIAGHKVEEALELTIQKSIVLSEEMADLMSDAVKNSQNEKTILIRIGDICAQQQQYHLACKKYTQGGDRLRAMTALLRSADNEKIIFFANVSGPKQPEIFVMAANYLQTLDWRNDPNIMKSIITFYTKAKALENLAGFYEACAQVEIDEYQNYEKALGALREALKCVTKGRDINDKERKMEILQYRLELISKFVQARRIANTDPMEMFRICDELLMIRDVEHAVRQGDIFALVIETLYANNRIDEAFTTLQRMRSRIPNASLDFYIDPQVLNAIDKTRAFSTHDHDANAIAETF